MDFPWVLPSSLVDPPTPSMFLKPVNLNISARIFLGSPLSQWHPIPQPLSQLYAEALVGLSVVLTGCLPHRFGRETYHSICHNPCCQPSYPDSRQPDGPRSPWTHSHHPTASYTSDHRAAPSSSPGCHSERKACCAHE